MLGKVIKIKCAKCNKEYVAHFTICAIYKDKNGEFYIDPLIKCECGHVLNSERILDAEYIAKVCL
jgi:hypothetical protein